MFAQKLQSNNRKFSLYITIKCTKAKKFRIWAEEFQKQNSKYADREIVVEGERTIHFNFPVSPQALFIGVLNSENPEDKDFSVDLQEKDLITYNVWLDSETRDFLSLAVPFSQISGFSPATQQGRIFTTDDKEFTIKYFDVIRDQKTGQPMNTPARIGHKSGIIETAKVKFDKYTIPMRLVILLHEFSHKYKNPKMGLDISDETGADINALYIYLGLGFSKIDAICVFANVFLKAQTKGNIERMRKIMDYIQKFENQEFAKRN
jgi:hypothetical protein